MKRNRLGTMAYQVGIQSHIDLDVNALKSITNDIFESATINPSTSDIKVRTVTGIDLYNGKVDAETARKVAMTNSGLQVTLSNKLNEKVKFLNAKAAATNLKGTKTAIANAVKEISKDYKGVNPFAGANTSVNKKAPGYLFINAA